MGIHNGTAADGKSAEGLCSSGGDQSGRLLGIEGSHPPKIRHQRGDLSTTLPCGVETKGGDLSGAGDTRNGSRGEVDAGLQYSRGAEGEDCDGAAIDYAARRHAGVGPGEGAHDQPESWGARGQLRPGPEEDGTSAEDGEVCPDRHRDTAQVSPVQADGPYGARLPQGS